MALVTISGFPCSGKTTRAKQLQEFLSGHPSTSQFKISIINDESCGLDIKQYDDTRSEKPLRATLMSSTIRAMDRNTIVLCDGMNYIKGFRYQLYCAAREAGVRTLTVHIATPAEQCREWNKARTSKQYTPETLDNLISRYEEPSPFTRWDSPLVVIPWTDEQLPETDIIDALTKAIVKPPNQAVVHHGVSSSNYLQRLESVTSAVIASLLAALPSSNPGEMLTLPVSLPSGGSVTVYITLPPLGSAPPNPARLQRLKRQYTTLNKQARGELSDDRIAELWANWLDGSFRGTVA